MTSVISLPVVSLQCLYCEKTFRDKTTLKDHMRKKAHRRINSNNREYDRFYIINYLVKPDTESGIFWVGLVCLVAGVCAHRPFLVSGAGEDLGGSAERG